MWLVWFAGTTLRRSGSQIWSLSAVTLTLSECPLDYNVSIFCFDCRFALDLLNNIQCLWCVSVFSFICSWFLALTSGRSLHREMRERSGVFCNGLVGGNLSSEKNLRRSGVFFLIRIRWKLHYCKRG